MCKYFTNLNSWSFYSADLCEEFYLYKNFDDVLRWWSGAFSHGLRHSQSNIYRYQISLIKAPRKCPHVVAGSIMSGNESWGGGTAISKTFMNLLGLFMICLNEEIRFPKYKTDVLSIIFR